MYSFEEIVKDVFLLKTPFSCVWTGIVLIKGEKNYLIDSGADEPEVYLIPALKELGLDITQIDCLLNTHSHGDHITGHYTLVNTYGLKIAVFKGGEKNLRDPKANAIKIRSKFPAFSPPPQSWLKGVDADILLDDHEVLDGRLKMISTPGHDDDCVCILDLQTKTLFTGDSLQANGTTSQGVAFYQDLNKYKNSVERLLKEDIENIVCAHDYDGIGSVIVGKENCQKALAYCKTLPNVYQQTIEQIITEGYEKPEEIAIQLINRIGIAMPEKLFLPLYTTTEHLKEIKK